MRVGEYPDRDATPRIREALEAHAGDCPSCARDLSIFRAMSDGFAAIEPIGASAGFEVRLERQLARERAGSERPWYSPFSIPSWAPAAGLALAAGIAIVLAGFLWNARQPGTRSTSDLAAEPIRSVPSDPSLREPDRSLARTDVESRDVVPVRVTPASPSSPNRGGVADRWNDEELARLLDDEGVPLTPPTGGRQYVIDRPSDLPGFVSGGAEGEVASTPIF